MSAVLPGKPQSRLQGLASARWNKININAYISGNAFTILNGARIIIQTIYDDDEQHLQAITVDEGTGKIATCTSTQVRVYKPLGLKEDAIKWALELSFEIPDKDINGHTALSWGSFEELLVAGTSLALFSTKGAAVCSWIEKLPSAVKLASLSYDSAYIASIGFHDRLVKVWRRLTYAGEVRFELSYIRHPDFITDIRWRRPFHIEQAADNVLYTFCLDGCLRVWTATDTNEGFQWRLWGSINVGNSLGRVNLSQDMWLACIIDGRDFTASVERVVEERMADDQSTDDVALDHLVAVARKSPEIYLAVNSRGSLSAWALDVASNRENETRIFNIAQFKSQRLESLDGFLQPNSKLHVEIQAYCDRQSGLLHFLLHSFDGRVGIFTSCVADLLDPTINDKRLSLHAVWSGHSASIKKMVRNFSGRAVVSRTRNGETVVWSHVLKNQGRISPSSVSGLLRRSIIPEEGHIHRICLLRQGRFVVFLREKALWLWDCRSGQGHALAQCPYETAGKPLCLIILPRPHVTDNTTAHIATVTSERRGIVWEVSLPRFFEDQTRTTTATTTGARIREFCSFELEDVEDLKYVLPVDPAGSAPVASGFLDVFARDIAVSYTRTGRVDLWTARIDLEKGQVDWLSTCCTETGVSEPALVSGSTLKKVALVNSARSQLTIWDIGGSRLEFEEDYETHNSIQDLDWTSTPDAQSILAVGFQYRVVLLSQMRFDYLNRGPAWAPIREISIRELTPHPIGDSTWLGDGYLVIGAGNQLFIYDRGDAHTDPSTTRLVPPYRKDRPWDLFEVVQRYNGPLPVFHPQFLSQCIVAGKTTIVRKILVELYKTLKFLVPGESVDNYLGLDLEDFYVPTTETHRRAHERTNGSFLDRHLGDEDEDIFSDEIATYINEKLTKLRIPQLSGQEQIQLVDMIECVALVERQRRSMDENGARFMLFFRQHALRKGRTNEIQISWREINWAFHSKSQDILVDFVSRQNHGSMLWEHARDSGIFMWLTDSQSIRHQFEVIARNEYTKSDTKNPVDCSLFYLALRKKTVLQGLWRMASWNKEQGATQRLLANNFDDPKWRTVALKNAYALLSKRRFEYAAAFFLLARNLEAAVEICLRRLQDVQLAIALTRVYEGDHGPVLTRLLQEEVLPLAAQQGNRWLASWAFWMLGRKDMSVRALITPVYTLLETPCSPDLKSRLFLTDDPALVVLYSQLRQQTLQTLRGASKVSPKVEWEFVLHSAKLYDRMGCDLLGLDLVRNWEFQQSGAVGFGGMTNPLSLLRRRSSLVVNDLPSDLHMSVMQGQRAKHALAAAPLVDEPDAESLLNSFGM